MSELIITKNSIISRVSDENSTSTIKMIGSIVTFEIEKKEV